jgi:multidrug efflux pump subunit AcrA (membrane-fusion protein)
MVDPPSAQIRAVRTGNSNTTVVEILDGLSAGELVVVGGLFALRDGAAVIIESADSLPP